MTADEEMDFSQMTNAQLFAVAKAAPAEGLAKRGRACASLHDNGLTWEEIGREMGVNLSTAYRWAKPYLRQ